MPPISARFLQPAEPGAIGSVPHPNIGRTPGSAPDGRPALAISIGFPGRRKTRAKPDVAGSSRADRSRWRRRRVDRQPSSVAPRLHDALYHRRSHRAGLDDPARPDQPSHRPGPERHGPGRPSGGMLLWIAYGMIGSLAVLPAPGGHSVWTFHFPVRGRGDGPWRPDRGRVGRLHLHASNVASSNEVPWYGTLANHSVLAFAAVVGGLTAQVVNGALLTTSASVGVAGLVALTGGTHRPRRRPDHGDRRHHHAQGGPVRRAAWRDPDRVRRTADRR